MSWLRIEIPSRLIVLMVFLINFCLLAPQLWTALTRPDDLQLPTEHSQRQRGESSALVKKLGALTHRRTEPLDKDERLELGVERKRIQRQFEALGSRHQAEDEKLRVQLRKGILQRGATFGGFAVVVLVWSFWRSKPVDIESLPGISAKVASICDDPNRKQVEAVKAYCNETGLGIKQGSDRCLSGEPV